MRKRRVAALARVSTIKASQDTSPENQLDDVRSYFAKRGDEFEIVMERVDRVSGSKGERRRPGLADVLAAAREGKIDVIACTKIDRLFRSLDKWLAVSVEMQGLGVSIVYVHHPEMDPTTPAGKLLGVIYAALAEYQRELWKAGTEAGKQRAIDEGKHCARPREEVQPEALAYILAQVQAGRDFTWREMSEELASASPVPLVQPARYIKTTGALRPARPWNPGTLWKAFRDARRG